MRRRRRRRRRRRKLVGEEEEKKREDEDKKEKKKKKKKKKKKRIICNTALFNVTMWLAESLFFATCSLVLNSGHLGTGWSSWLRNMH